MGTNGILHSQDHLHQTGSSYTAPEDSASFTPECESESNIRSITDRTQQWEPNRHTTVTYTKHHISRQLRKLFSKDTAKQVNHIEFECKICEHPALAFRHYGKALLEPKIIFSFGFSIAAIIISVVHAPALVIFIWNLMAIVPLSITLTFATERLSRDLGETSGALLNISIGNLAEMIILTALLKNNIRVVQASLLGSVLVNLLLVLGSAIIAGGIMSPDQTYNTDLTHSFVGLLNLTMSCLMIPSAFYGSVKNVHSADEIALSFSRGVSIILLGIYFLYLFFQFRPHPHVFRSHSSGLQGLDTSPDRISYNRPYEQVYSDEESQPILPDTPTGNMSSPSKTGQVPSPPPPTNLASDPADIHVHPGLPMVHIETIERSSSHPVTWNHSEDHGISSDRDDHYCRNLALANRTISLGLLVSSTFLIAVCAEFLALSFATLNKNGILGESFVGLIVIPIAGNVAENVTAIIVAGKDQMDLAISVALGSAIQIGLLVAPVIVLAGWALDMPMSLHFDRFEMVTLVGAVLLVSFIILKGKTNYLEGAILCASFATISVGAFLLPIA